MMTQRGPALEETATGESFSSPFLTCLGSAQLRKAVKLSGIAPASAPAEVVFDSKQGRIAPVLAKPCPFTRAL